MTADFSTLNATEIAAAIREKKVSAKEIIAATLERIDRHNSSLNCFTEITRDRAISQAETIDTQIARGEDPGILAGVPFAVKNLFDVAGVTTLAGSKINAENPPATEDATAISRLQQAGAILVGTLNMDEYAYGFVTENSHYGATHNPHDRTRIAGGSSGGSAAAVAGGLVPFTLGSDTNGSIRVPAALCGIFGFKPTYGRLSRSGAALFSGSLDCIGPMGRSVRDIATAFDAMQGTDATDPVCTARPSQPIVPELDRGIDGLRIAVADGYFDRNVETEAKDAVSAVARALNVTRPVSIPEADRAKAAAYLITASEGSNLHLANLRSRPEDFDPATRDRFLAGALIPATWYLQSQRFRQWFRHRVREVFQEADIILAPTTPCVAPKIGQTMMEIDGTQMLVRPNLGLFTQPLSFIGLPVVSVPVCRPDSLPLGVQIVAAPHCEASILRVAGYLERQGVISAQLSVDV